MCAALASAFDRFAEACVELGLPAWRVDAVRREWRAPDQLTLQQLAQDQGLMDAIASVATAIENDSQEWTIVDWLPGVRLVCLREIVRRQRFAWVITILPETGCGTTLATRMSDQTIDAATIEQTLQPCFFEGEQQARFACTLLRRLHTQAINACSDEIAINDFTTQLTIAYESAVMMSSVAESMSRIEEPEAFLHGAIEELFASLPFGWVALVRADVEDLARVCAPKVIMRHDPRRFDEAMVSQAALDTTALYADAIELQIEPCPAGLDETLGPELIVLPLKIDGSFSATLLLGARQGDEWAVSSYDTLPVRAIGASITAFLEIVLAYQRQEDSFVGTLGGLSKALDAKDTYTRGHSDRVAYLATELAKVTGLDDHQVRLVHIAGIVHDIGKIGVPEAVLKGDRKLTDEEFAQIKKHPSIGYEILKNIPMLRDALPGVLHHHERWDGTGYPSRITGEQTPAIARILALVDAFDAMSSNRSYQTGQKREEVLAEIRRCSGTHFDPELVNAFFALDLTEYDHMLEAEAKLRDASDTNGRSIDRAA